LTQITQLFILEGEYKKEKSITKGATQVKKKHWEKGLKEVETHLINALLPRDLGKHSNVQPLRCPSAVVALPAPAAKAPTFSGSFSPYNFLWMRFYRIYSQIPSDILFRLPVFALLSHTAIRKQSRTNDQHKSESKVAGVGGERDTDAAREKERECECDGVVLAPKFH